MRDEILKDICGKRYRWHIGEDGFRQTPLRGDRGHIYQHGEEVLGTYIITTYPNMTLKAIQRKCPAATMHQDGEGECVILCPVADAKKFFSACHAKTRRQVSPVEVAKFSERLRQFQFSPVDQETIERDLSRRAPSLDPKHHGHHKSDPERRARSILRRGIGNSPEENRP